MSCLCLQKCMASTSVPPSSRCVAPTYDACPRPAGPHAANLSRICCVPRQVLTVHHNEGKHSIIFLPMFPASSDKLQQACTTCHVPLSDDAAAAIALPLIAAAAGLAGVGLGHCGEQIDQVARVYSCMSQQHFSRADTHYLPCLQTSSQAMCCCRMGTRYGPGWYCSASGHIQY
jgi:hypothetical protein